ncbi:MULTISPECIES: helix-turn-helix transcriptional regulator [unclassified Rhizobium]|jgi:DNA-binding transcriptional ArsR family regulator|uniref:ArsR/SmtB family transcription factor n=1 Tax=unclassified Rhizobium TaxID=2613769 RepID=UPI0006491A21|nr:MULTISPECIES: helix-turn-helix transcriptional regulator [unclassified Rhizobium]MBN8954457.1 helix-turn-helix transcriptional regulator [Rhizobium tropici]OJY77622.1 MAG: transcriptional regulator [Rhizobium sp. 60-20]RKD56185.1 ArsR family transcriptional regulator [Rhizobium sp. WW_1]
MIPQPNIAAVAFLIADPARAAMLSALLDGRARPAGELAYAAGVTAQTASSHLGKLLDGGLVTVETEGRHRYYRLAGPHVALALETLASIGPGEPVRRKPLTREAQKLRFARCCYDHLAGRVGVAVTHGLLEKGFIVAADKKRFELTPAGTKWFDRMGMNTAGIRPTRYGLARQCLDWTERQHHLAGPLGVHLTNLFFAEGCLRRSPSSRAVDVTPKGWKVLNEHFGIQERALL